MAGLPIIWKWAIVEAKTALLGAKAIKVMKAVAEQRRSYVLPTGAAKQTKALAMHASLMHGPCGPCASALPISLDLLPSHRHATATNSARLLAHCNTAAALLPANVTVVRWPVKELRMSWVFPASRCKRGWCRPCWPL
jgi:hypothetical protein